MDRLQPITTPNVGSMIDRNIQALPYYAPILTMSWLLVAKLHSAIYLESPSRRNTSKGRRRSTVAFILAVITTFALQLGCYLADYLTDRDVWPNDQDVVGCLTSILVYTVITGGLVEDKSVHWKHFTGTWVVALALELSSWAILYPQARQSADLLLSPARLQFTRLLLYLACCLQSAWFHSTPIPGSAAHGAKTTSIQIDGLRKSTSTAKSLSDSDADFDSEGDDPGREKELKAQRMQRLRDSGDWFTFLGQYKIFLPMVWPFGNWKLQSCVAFLGFHLMIRRILGILVPRQLGIITNKFATGATRGEVPWSDIAAWLILAALDSEFFSSLRNFAFLPVQQYAYKSISAAAFRHVMTLSMDFHNEKSSSELVRTVEQGQRLSDMLSFICFDVLPLFVDLGIALVFITYTFDAYMTFIVVLGGLGYVWLGLRGIKWSVKARRRYNLAMREQDKVQYEGLNNWATVSHFHREKYESDRYDAQIERFNKAERGMYFAYNGIGSLQGSIMTLARLTAMALAMFRVSQGAIPVGHLVTFTAVWSTIMNPITGVTWTMKRVQSMLTDSERLLQLLQTKPTIVDSPTAKELQLALGRIEFTGVGFAYDPRKPILKDITFTAEPGMTVALVGETGGGKSTILKLLYRYFDVTKGTICIDGQDIRDVTIDSLREVYGMVPQDPALFNITLMENLRYARLDATDEEVMAACRAACIHDKIMSFPDQYECKVGERGVKLSGGEMQRMAIARAILRDPKIVLLDEATSMIDAETEAEIQKALKQLTAGRTTFVIAHRLSTIQHADLILVVHNGEVTERGTHDELFQQNGKYVALWSKQMSKGFTDSFFAHNARSEVSTPISSNDEDYSADSEEDSKDFPTRPYMRHRQNKNDDSDDRD